MRWEVINTLINRYNCKSYLEIGVQNRNNFDRIECEFKFSLDPAGNADYIGTSDEFFEQECNFDIVFIDGLHHSDQVERDILNSINIAGAKVVVVHDCLPINEASQRVPRETKQWYGDVWRAFVGFVEKYPETDAFCLDFDCGVGVIIVNGKIEKGFISDMSYTEFEANKKQLLKLCSTL